MGALWQNANFTSAAVIICVVLFLGDCISVDSVWVSAVSSFGLFRVVLVSAPRPLVMFSICGHVSFRVRISCKSSYRLPIRVFVSGVVL